MFNDFTKPLIVFEMANNHMGDLIHGQKIIHEFGKVADKFRDQFRFAFKLQLRHESIIHPEYKDREDIKMVKRLNDTRLTSEEFIALKKEIEKNGFLSMCTPFDEPSVELVEKLGFQIIKIASCSCADWPLIEAIAKTDMPVIFSTGGARLEDVDAMVAFMEHRKKDFAVMHCVGAYPTHNDQLQMNQIDLFKQRYPGTPIGFSTHEDPFNTDAIKIAVAKGCKIFERHVALEDEKYSINAYSSTPAQVYEWLSAASSAFEICGSEPDRRMNFSDAEIADLNNLYRGSYAKREIEPGEILSQENTFFAMPIAEGQLASREFSKYMSYTAVEGFKTNEPIMTKNLSLINSREQIGKIIKQMSKILRDGNVVPPDKVEMSISSHYGIDHFEEWGVIMINVLNREYCKKLLVMLPGQKHPTHLHKIKEETFHILSGEFHIVIDEEDNVVKKGELLTVLRGQKHSFWSEGGGIIEEISTTHLGSDSYYDDESINNNKNRKINLTYWSNFYDL